MAPNLTEDEIDDLLYFARTGESADFQSTAEELSSRENCSLSDLLHIAKDEHSGNGPLHMAAANGHADLLESLIRSLSTPPQNPTLLALLNAQNDSGNTPLHWAALNGHLSCVKALVDNGSDPTVTNKAGHDPVYEAELNDRKEVVEWVLKEGGDGLESGIAGDEGEGGAGEDEDEDEADDVEMDGAEGVAGSSSEAEGLDEGLKEKLRSLGFEEDKNKGL